LTMMLPMGSSHHRAALTEAIAAATARFQADVRRLARTVLADELGSLVATLELTLSRAGARVEHAEPVVVVGRRSPMAGPCKATARRAEDADPVMVVVGRRGSPVAGLRKPAATATTSKPVAAARASKSGAAARTRKPAAAVRASEPAAARTSKPGAAGTRKPAESPIAELPITESPFRIAGPVPAAAGPVPAAAGPVPAAAVSEDPAVAIAELEPRLTAPGAQVEPASAGPHPELAPVAELGPAATHEELPWRERAQAQREESAQRRKQRQERARIRREEAAGKRTGSAAAAGARAAPAAPVHEEVPGPDGTRAMGLRMQRGIVKWFNEAKGYGFIQGNDGVDVFVHRSEIVGDGFRTRHEGQTVEYVQAQSGKGLLAVDVVPMAQGTEAPRQ